MIYGMITGMVRYDMVYEAGANESDNADHIHTCSFPHTTNHDSLVRTVSSHSEEGGT